MKVESFDSLGSGFGSGVFLEEETYWVRIWTNSGLSTMPSQETWRVSQARDFWEVYEWARAQRKSGSFEVFLSTTDHHLGRKGLEPMEIFHRLFGEDPTENNPGKLVWATSD